MSKHTPGPWNVIVSKSQEADFYIEGHPNKGYWKVAAIRGRELKEENLANARLIAAAPELLVELEADEAALQLSPLAFYAKYGYNISERGKRRRAAIAKAYGEYST